MLGKTHMAVGVAVSLILVHPATLPELVLGTGVAAIGGVISDIDIGTSGSRKELNTANIIHLYCRCNFAALKYIKEINMEDSNHG